MSETSVPTVSIGGSARADADEDAHHRLRLELAGIEYRPLAPSRSRHVVLRGMRFHYLEWGRDERPPVVLLHVGGQTCRTWDLVCHELAAEYRCLALDARGHGDSEWSYTGDYRAAEHGADVASFIEALDLGPHALVGMSMGCLSGIEYALARGSELRAFVAVDAGPWVQRAGVGPIRSFLERVAGLDTLDAFVDAALRFNTRRDRRLLERSIRHNLRARHDGTYMWKTDLRRRPAVDDVFAELEAMRERVAGMPCPTLVVRGGESPCLLDADAKRFADAVPDGRWVRIEGAGHTVQGDQPRALIAEIRRFFGEVGYRPR